MSVGTPTFRKDLVATPVREGDEQFFDVSDPKTGETFRFFEVEYAIAMAMDGTRDPQNLAHWALGELGLEVEAEDIQTLIGTLQDLGYLATTQGHQPEFAATIQSQEPLVLDPDGDGQLDFDDSAPTNSSPLSTGVEIGVDDDAVTIPETSLRAEPGLPPLGAQDQQSGGLFDANEDKTRQVSPEQAQNPFGDEFEKPTRAVPEAEAAVAGDPVRGPETADPFGNTFIAREDTGDFGPEGTDQKMFQKIQEQRAKELAAHKEHQDRVRQHSSNEVSVDLAEHLSVEESDVREAVRQSQNIEALDPEEFAKAAQKPPLPRTTEQIDRSKHEFPAVTPPKKKGSKLATFIVLILCLGVLGVGGYFGYERYYKKKDNQDSAKGSVGISSSVPSKQPPLAQGVVKEVSTSGEKLSFDRSGEVSIKVEDGATVKKDDVIATIGDVSDEEQSVKKYTDKIEKDYGSRMIAFKQKLKAAEDDKDSSDIKKWQDRIEELERKIARKQKLLDRAREKLLARSIVAPEDGEVKLLVKDGSEVKKGVTIAKMAGDPALEVTLKIPKAANVKVAIGQEMALPIQGQRTTAKCTVVGLGGDDAVIEATARCTSVKKGQTVLLPAK